MVLLFSLAIALIYRFAFYLERGLFTLGFVFLAFFDHFGEDFLCSTELIKRAESEHLNFSKGDILYYSASSFNLPLELIL